MTSALFALSLAVGLALAAGSNILEDRCTQQKYDQCNPNLMSAPGDRVGCSLFLKTGKFLPYVLETDGNVVKGEINEMRKYHATTEPCSECGDIDCLVMDYHPDEEMDGSTLFMSNPDFENNGADPKSLPYVAMLDCAEGGKLGKKYIDFRTADITDEQLNDIKTIYGIDVNMDDLKKCMAKKDKIYPQSR